MLIPLHLHDYLLIQQKIDYKLTQKLIWFISFLNNCRYTNSKYELDSEIEIPKTFIETMLTKADYKRVLNKLENDSIIKINHNYQYYSHLSKVSSIDQFGNKKFGKCKTYKFVDSNPLSSRFWYNQGVKSINPITSTKLELKQLKMRNKDAIFLNDLSNITLPKDYNPTFEDITDENELFYNLRQIEQIENIKNGNHYAIRDNYGRLHTSLTNIKTIHRNNLIFKNIPELNIEGQTIKIENNSKTESVDIVCSQMYTFILVLIKHFPYLKNSEELNRLYKLVMGSAKDKTDIYSHIQKLAKLDHLTRNEFKPMVFGRLLYCKKYDNYSEENIINNVFRNEFPIIHECMLDLKSGDYTALPKMMQKMESDYIYNDIVPILRQHNIPFFTVHDAVYFPENQTLKTFIENIFKKESRKFGYLINVA